MAPIGRVEKKPLKSVAASPYFIGSEIKSCLLEIHPIACEHISQLFSTVTGFWLSTGRIRIGSLRFLVFAMLLGVTDLQGAPAREPCGQMWTEVEESTHSAVV